MPDDFATERSGLGEEVLRLQNPSATKGDLSLPICPLLVSVHSRTGDQGVLASLERMQTDRSQVGVWPGTASSEETVEYSWYHFGHRTAEILEGVLENICTFHWPVRTWDVCLWHIDEYPWLETVSAESTWMLNLGEREHEELLTDHPEITKHLMNPGERARVSNEELSLARPSVLEEKGWYPGCSGWATHSTGLCPRCGRLVLAACGLPNGWTCDQTEMTWCGCGRMDQP